ncbi:MAG TPA: BACON domain-containing carbohydrate-binding protein [Candidatus Thermoplasmatota archaeon]|nr:BACON domain-containing carbohydrate-binding protein [Candidatus Thermoplasmatota archaeon]
MKTNTNSTIIGAGVVFLLIVSTIGPVCGYQQKNNPQPVGVMTFDPTSHDFGNMSEGQIGTTVFQIWKTGGCCEVTFQLTCDSPWITVFPTSGVSNGEKINITVTVNTTGLEQGPYAGNVLITSDGGDGVFNVNVNIVSYNSPWLSINPTDYYYGIVPKDSTKSTTLDIWNSGKGTLTYTVSCPDSWVEVAPQSGSSTGEHHTVTVTINTNGLIQGDTHESNVYIDSNGGNKVFFIWFIIGTAPNIGIVSVTGGLFRINAVIINGGTADAVGVDWKISVGGNGLVLLGKESKGTLDNVPMGEERTITSGLILGFGKVVVQVTAQNSETKAAELARNAHLIMVYIRM